MHGLPLSLGVLVLMASTCAIADAARRLALRSWPGEPVVQLAGGLLLGTSMIVGCLTALGVAGLLSGASMLALSAGMWAVVTLVTRPQGAIEGAPVPKAGLRLPSPGEIPYLAPAAVLVLLLGGAILFSILQPRPVFDVVAGHLPVPVQWLQSGNIRGMPYVSPLSLQPQYPANGELLDLWLILPVHRDFLVQLGSLPGLAMTIAGVIMAIRELGGRWLSAVAWALLIPTLPRVFSELVGTNMDDLLLVGLVAVMAAFVARHRRLGGSGSLLMAALALGIAAGTRYAALVVLPPLVLLLTLQLIVIRPRLRRLVPLLSGAGGIALLAGGYWYLRNTLITGDPVYPQDIPGHSVQATEKVVFPWIRSYANLGFDPHDWIKGAEYMLRGYGPVAILLVVGVLLPPLLAARRREHELAGWAWSLLPGIGLICFLVTPGSAGYQIDGQLVPSLQSLSLRYILPVLPYSAILLGLESSRLSAARERVVVAAVTATAVVAVLALGIYSPDFPAPFISARSFVVAVVVGAGIVALLRFEPSRAMLLSGATIAVLGIAILSPTLAAHYDGSRASAGMPFEDLRLRLGGNASIAVAGFCEIYGLYNPELDRQVEYLTGTDDQVNRPIDAGYPAWLASLRSHRATAVVLATDQCFSTTHVPQRGWVVEHPDVFRPVYASAHGAIYAIAGT